MKLDCCYTVSHKVLFDKHFYPSIPLGMSVEATLLDALQTSGDFAGAGYNECLRQKIRLVVESLASGEDDIIVWSDVDIVFLRQDVAEDLQEQLKGTGCDALFQREGKQERSSINGGFYVCRANERSLAFFRKVLAILEEQPHLIDQDVIYALLSADPPLTWGLLPLTYYARTHGWPPPRNLMLYHANETIGIGGVRRKLQQINELYWIRRHGWPAIGWSCLMRIPKRMKRLARLFLKR